MNAQKNYLEVGVKKVTTPKGDVDLHKHKDAENRPTTVPV